jgi:hypothetical protein
LAAFGLSRAVIVLNVPFLLSLSSPFVFFPILMGADIQLLEERECCARVELNPSSFVPSPFSISPLIISHISHVVCAAFRAVDIVDYHPGLATRTAVSFILGAK